MQAKIQAGKITPPYVSFTTLENVLDRLGGGAMPPRLDKGYLENLAGGTVSAVLSTLRGFDLISDDGTISETLADMAKDSECRRSKWREILDKFYPEQLVLAQQNATALQLEESFRGMGISGSTIRKSIVFYLALVENTGAPNSPHFHAPKQKQSIRKSRKDAAGGRGDSGGDDDGRSDDQGDGGQSVLEVRLPSGATVTLSISANFLELTNTERKFVFGLVDQIQGFDSDDEDES